MKKFFRAIRRDRKTGRTLEETSIPVDAPPPSAVTSAIPVQLSDGQVAPIYRYQPLLKKGDIRIFKFHTNHTSNDYAISGQLETINLDDTKHSPYTALSYTWGSPFPCVPPWDDIVSTSHKILCDGRSLVALGNLHDALLVLHQRYPDNAYWIDALCINQEDDNERSSQVRIMGDIYAEAARTIVWLGVEDEASKIALPLLDEFSTKLQKKESEVFKRSTIEFNDPELFSMIGLSPFNDKEWQAISDFFTRSWFRRLWVSQEFALSRSLDFMCGHLPLSHCIAAFAIYIRLLDWQFAGVLRWRKDRQLHHKSGILTMYNVSRLRRMVVTDSKYMYLSPTQSLGVFPLFEASTKTQVNGAVLGEILLYSAGLLCSDERDMVYAPLALAARMVDLSEDSQSFPVPDYSKSLDEICIETSRYLLDSASGLGLLSIVERKDPPVLDIPTWVVDFARITMPRLLGELPHQATKSWVSGGKRIEGRLLKVWGIKFDDILHVTVENTRKLLDTGGMLRICAKLESQNHLKNRSVRTLLEILGHNPADAIDLDDPVVIAAAKHYIQFHMVQNVNRKSYYSEIPYDFLAAQIDNPFLPTPSELKSFQAEYKKNNTTLGNAHWDGLMIEPMNLVRRPFDDLIRRRCIAGTLKGNLALCPGAAAIGDEIWFLRGGKVPFALRPLKNGNYELVGESYLHGFMQGEIFETGGKSIGDAVEISIQ